MVEEIMKRFNDAFGTKINTGRADQSKMLVMRIRERPDVGIALHEKMIAQTKANPWWGGDKPTTVGVIYSPNTFPRALAKAEDEAMPKSNAEFGRAVNEQGRALLGLTDEEWARIGATG
jgi:hypothetical protein